MPCTRPDRTALLKQAAAERILIIDGAMGTMIQRHKLDEAGYRGARFKGWNRDVKGNNDLLVLTQPRDHPRDPRRTISTAGADIIETNTFNAQTISMADYGMEELAYEINVVAGPHRPRGLRTSIRAERPDAAALRRRRRRADQPHRLDLARRQQPGLPQRLLRRVARGLCRAGARA